LKKLKGELQTRQLSDALSGSKGSAYTKGPTEARTMQGKEERKQVQWKMENQRPD
jgi:hypothetical protein